MGPIVGLCMLSLVMLAAIDFNNGEDTESLDSPLESQIKRLRREIFEKRKYDKHVIPRAHHSNTTVVTFGIELLQIDLDERHHVLTTEALFLMYWNDHHLPWQRADFGQMRQITLRSSEIWKPDILSYNGGSGSDLTSGLSDQDCVVYSSGEVTWVPSATVKTVCTIDLRDYPFDQQVCTLVFGSWTTDGNVTDLRHLNRYIHWYSPTKDAQSPEFDIINNSTIREVQIFPEWDPYTPFPSLRFSLTLRRRTSVYTYLIVIPWIMATCLTLTVYLLSPLSMPLRKGLATVGCFIFLSLLLYMGFTLGFASLNVPTAVKIISMSTLLSGMSLLWSIGAYNLALSDSELPHILKGCIDSVRPVLERPLCLPKTGQVRAGQNFQRMGATSEEEEGCEPRAETSLEKRRREDWLLLVVTVDRLVGLLILVLMLIQHA